MVYDFVHVLFPIQLQVALLSYCSCTCICMATIYDSLSLCVFRYMQVHPGIVVLHGSRDRSKWSTRL